MWLWHIATIKERNHTGTIRHIDTQLTYMYQGHSVTGSLRLAPVRPEHGMKWMSFLGLKPTFFRKGTSFSLHSSYLQGSSKRGRQHLVRQHTGVSYVRPDCQNCQKCKTAATCGDVCDHPVWISTSRGSSWRWGRPSCWSGRWDAWLLPSWPAWRAPSSGRPFQSPSQTPPSWLK